ICCNRFLSQSVLSPEWPVGCLCSHGNCLIVSSGPRQITVLEWINDECGGRQLKECQKLDVEFPIIQVRYCSQSDLLVALCSSAEPADRSSCGGGTVCQAFHNWRSGGCWRHQFAGHRRANLIRVDADKVAIAEARTVSVYSLKPGIVGADDFCDSGFELATVLQMEFVLTQLEMKRSGFTAELCLLAAAANRLLLLQLRPRPVILLDGAERASASLDDEDGANVFSLFDFDDLVVSSAAEGEENRTQGKLESKPKERLFPDTRPVCQVQFSQSEQPLTVKTWLVKTLALQADERLHSLKLRDFDSDNLMAFFSTHSQGFIFCVNFVKNRIEKILELRYNSDVSSAVIGADGLLHTMSTDLVESYTTHQPLCRLSSVISESVSDSGPLSTAVPNLLIGSQMFPGIFAVAAHDRGLLLVSSAADADEEATAGGGRPLSTLYTLVFESAGNLVEDLIDKCLEFKQDSEDICQHLAREAAFILQTSESAQNASQLQKQKILEFCAELIEDQPEDCIGARLMLEFLNPDLEVLLPAVSLDAAKLLKSSSLVSYIRDGLLKRANFCLPGHQSAVWPCLEQLLRALLARETSSSSANLLIRLLALLPSNGPTLCRLCSHQLPRLNPDSLLYCLTASAAEEADAPAVTTAGEDGCSSMSGLSEAEICDSLPSLARLIPLKQFGRFFQKLFAQQPLAVCGAMELIDSQFDWQFAKQLPWPLSIYFVEVRWLQQMTDLPDIDITNSNSMDQFKQWSDLLMDLLNQAVRQCQNGGSGCKLPIDVSLSTPEGLLKRLLSLLYNLPGMESRQCCCLAFVAQRVLLLLWLQPGQPPPSGFDALCRSLGSAHPSLALCISQAPLLIGCRELTNPELRARRLLPLIRLDGASADTRRRLIGCLGLQSADWLALIQAADGSQSDCEAVCSLASHFADRATLESLLDADCATGARPLFHCAGRESLRNQRDELTRLLAAQLAE
ncbi:hypothetical protein BOX15_Mlig011539g2, partial [Macrostomum lignano]